MKRNFAIRTACMALVALLLVTALASCSNNGDVPDGYQDATCGGEYFRLYVPDGWIVQTQNGVSGAVKGNMSVTMVECIMADGATFEDFVSAHKAALIAEMGLDEGEIKMETLADQALASGHKTDMCDMRFSVATESDMADDEEGTDQTDAAVLKYRQILFCIKGDAEKNTSTRFYMLTYTAPSDLDGGFATFDMGSEEVNGMLKSMRVSDYPSPDTGLRAPGVDDGKHEGMVLVSTKAVAFRFYAPADWIIDTDNGNCLVYASETDRSNVSVLGYTLEETPSKDEKGAAIDDYWTETKESYERTLDNFMCDEPVESTLGSKAAKVYTYTYSLGGVTYKARQVIAVHSAAVYSLTYTALTENYELHLNDVKAMQNAFAFRTSSFD